MSEKLTEELLNELLFTKSLNKYLEKEEVDIKVKLSDLLQKKVDEKGLKKSDVIRKSKLDTTFGYQIFSGERNPTRDKALQLAFALELDIRETQRLLKAAGVNDLYPKVKRDAIIIHCIKNEKTLDETDDILFNFEEETICNG